MELIKNHLNIRSVNVLMDEIKKTNNAINSFITFNEYQINDVVLDYEELKTVLNNCSLKQKKKLRKYMFKINVKPSIAIINKYYHFLMKFVLKSKDRIKVQKSEKELKIQALRNEYKNALRAFKIARDLYNKEKGDFYKERILKGQKI